MKSAEEWKAELWEGQDYIVTGFGIQHPGVFREREADLIVAILHSATPLIQLDAWKQGMTDAARECRVLCVEHFIPERIEHLRDDTKSV